MAVSTQGKTYVRASTLILSILIIALTEFASAGPIAAQSTIEITGPSACRNCSITVEHVIDLGDDDGEGIIESDVATAARDSRGRYFVVESYGVRVKVFDSTGAFLTTLGRRGQGPGEFRGIGRLDVLPGDTLLVFDQSNSTVSRFLPDLTFIESIRLEIPPYVDVVSLDEGRMVLASPVRTPDRIGLPLHLLDRDGTVVRSFGSVHGEFRPDIPFADERLIGPGTKTAVWSAYRNQYVIELWDVSARPLREVRRNVEWFPSMFRPHRTAMHRRTTPEMPEPRLQAIRQDAAGHLWVLILVPDENWRQSVAQHEGDLHARVSDLNAYFDSVIEVLDPMMGRVIQSRTFDEAFLGFVGPGLLGGVTFTAAGSPRFSVWRVALTNP